MKEGEVKLPRESCLCRWKDGRATESRHKKIIMIKYIKAS